MNRISLYSRKFLLIILLSTFSISCSEEATEPTNGVDGTNGFNALVEIEEESAGNNCSSGGVRISVGQDSNENGTLDESEITSVSFICNGTDGNNGTNGNNGLNLLARTSPENPGEDCENGGTLVEIGTDSNGNNILNDNEVQTSFFVCNGTDGANGGSDGTNGLTSMIRVSSSSSCDNGGIEIKIGLDSNSNGELDDGEVDATYDICNGSDGSDGTNGTNGLDGYTTLSNIITEDPGANCANGGIKIELGLDTNNNGTLDNDEVVSENYVCNGTNGSNGSDGSDGSNGTDGSDGISSITRVSTEDPGSNCSNGGLIIEIGMDDITTDGVLQNDEVDYTYYVCNGSNGADGNDGSNGTDGTDGLNSLMRTSNELPGPNCSNGGIQIEIGLDTNNNGTLENGEVIGMPIFVCNGINGTNGADGSDGTNGSDGRDLIVVTDTDVTCPNGGIEFSFGYDDNGDGNIDELLETSLICNGNNGSNGSNGQDGLNSIVRSTNEDPGTNCANGGSFIEVGIDNNRNNTLDAGEVDASFYVCNGQDGSDGTNGTNGTNSLITVSSFSGSLGGCTNGGLIIRSGIDDDRDGTLDAGEVDATSYVCNGDDGTNGTDGTSDNIFEFYFQEGFDGYSGVLDASISDKNPTEVGETLSVDRGSTDSHGLIYFPELETLRDRVGEDFQIVEAILYLRAFSGRVDGQTQGNWLGVKTLNSSSPLFDETGVSWTRANSSDENWSIPGVTSQNTDGDANSYSDMFQLPATGNFAFDGYVPLKMSISEISQWADRDTGKDSNKGLVLLMANLGIQYELDIYTSNYSSDVNYRPTLYLKVKTGVKSSVSIENADLVFTEKWKKLKYKEKLAPLKRKIDRN
ncbi:DUF7151 family protein [Ekhidna sp.]